MAWVLSRDPRDYVLEWLPCLWPDGRASPKSDTGVPSVADSPGCRSSLGSRWRWGGNTAPIAPSSAGLCSQCLPCARGGGSGDYQTNDNGATEVTPLREVIMERKRRGSNPHLQNLPNGHRRVPILDFRSSPAVAPRWLSRREVPPTPRYRCRARKLTAEQESAIRALVSTKSLRALAADFGVSHETIRAVVRQDRSSSG
jgi:hypothetical protein